MSVQKTLQHMRNPFSPWALSFVGGRAYPFSASAVSRLY